jgi:hypothetical protein
MLRWDWIPRPSITVRGNRLALSDMSDQSQLSLTDASSGSASKQVRGVLESILAETPEVAFQVAVYLDGKLVIDTWAGMADPRAGVPLSGDTLYRLPVFSEWC